MTTTVRPASSEFAPSLPTHFTPDRGCTEASSLGLSPADCASFSMTAPFDTARAGASNSAAASDTVATGVAAAVYPNGPTISPIPTTFRKVVVPTSYIVPSSSHPQIRLVSRSASGNGSKIGGGVGGGLGALLLGLGIFLFLRYRKKRITQAEEGKPASPDPYQQQERADPQPKPECAPSPISGPEVYTEKPEPVPAPDHQGPVENMPSGLVELEAAPVARAMSPLAQGEGRSDGDGDGDGARSLVPAELPGSEVSIAELESPQLTATSPITTITAISTLTATTNATTPTITGASSAMGESQPPFAHRATSPRPPASLISRAISPSPSAFSYCSAPSEIHSLNEDTPRVLNPEERRQQLITLQEEVRRQEEAPPRRS